MDYEFRRDLYGHHQAKFSMGHEALGLWLTEELGADTELNSALLTKIEQLQCQQCLEHRQPGREFVLIMNRDDIEVRATLLDTPGDEAPDELNHYDQESYSSCGLDDFRRLLEAWGEFVDASNQ